MFVELLNEQNLERNLRHLGKDATKFRKTRFVYMFILLLFAGGAYFAVKDWTWFFTLPFAAIIGYKLPYYNLLSYKQKTDRLNTQMFPEFLVTFVALLPTSGNVYQALVASLEYTKEPLRSSLERLIRKIEDDNRREDYMDFADYIGTSEAYMLMDMIYQFSEYGIKKEALVEMQRFSQELDKNKMAELIEQKIVKMEPLGFIPVFISLFFILGFAGVIGWYYISDVMDVLAF